MSPRLRTVPAREIKRRGIGAVDELLKQGAVHVIKEDRPRYVVLSEELFDELVDGYQEAYLSRVRAALRDTKSGRARRFASTQELMRAIDETSTADDDEFADEDVSEGASRGTPQSTSPRTSPRTSRATSRARRSGVSGPSRSTTWRSRRR